MMDRKIQITVDSVSLTATLYGNKTADAVWDALPFVLPCNTWGDEIYFSIPVHTELEDGQEIVEIGDLAYWPPGHAFCIFYGRTPASTDDRPRAASEVAVFGKIEGDATVLCDANASTVKVQKQEND